MSYFRQSKPVKGEPIVILLVEDDPAHAKIIRRNFEIATDNLIAAQPDLVLRLPRDTLKGWPCAVEHPSDAGALARRYWPDAGEDYENAVAYSF